MTKPNHFSLSSLKKYSEARQIKESHGRNKFGLNYIL